MAPLSSWLRHSPFTAGSRVRPPQVSPLSPDLGESLVMAKKNVSKRTHCDHQQDHASIYRAMLDILLSPEYDITAQLPCGYSLGAKPQPSKLMSRVRFPLSAPLCTRSSIWFEALGLYPRGCGFNSYGVHHFEFVHMFCCECMKKI